MSEVIIVIVVLGLLGAIAVPVYNNIRAAGVDNVKTKNADLLNQLVTTVHNGGFDTSVWSTSQAAITALRTGVPIISRGNTMVVRLEKELNADAYTFVAANSTTLPTFRPVLGQANVEP